MSCKNPRRKGHDFERFIVHDMAEIYGAQVHRMDQRAGGFGKPDIIGTDHFIECKCGARPDIFKAMKQCLKNCPEPTDFFKFRTVIARKDHEMTIAVMPYEDFKKLIRDYKITREFWMKEYLNRALDEIGKKQIEDMYQSGKYSGD